MLTVRMASGIRSHFAARLPEWALSGHLSAFGLQFVRDDGVTFEASRSFAFIRGVMSEQAWGDLAIGIAFFWLMALVLDGTFVWFVRWSKWIRATSACLVFAYWSMMTVGILEANEHSPAVVNFVAAAALSFFIMRRTAKEAGTADRISRNAHGRMMQNANRE